MKKLKRRGSNHISVWVLQEAGTETGLEVQEIYWGNTCEIKRKEPENLPTLMQVGTVAGETEGRMEKEELRLHPGLAQIQPGHWVIPK